MIFLQICNLENVEVFFAFRLLSPPLAPFLLEKIGACRLSMVALVGPALVIGVKMAQISYNIH